MHTVVIIDYGMGNLFSVQRACEYVGMHARITSEKEEILHASAVILPGVGAFGDAMATLQKLDLIDPIREFVAAGKPFFGVCLGMQLLMTVSYEFGEHLGFDIIRGSVIRLDNPIETSEKILKVPEIGWNGIHMPNRKTEKNAWSNPLLSGLADGESMYFVHSFYVVPEEKALSTSLTNYGHIQFCSSLRYKNIFACQFHPERSGAEGLKIYRNLLSYIHAGETA